MQSYLEKHAFYERLINSSTPDDLEIAVICPAYNEEGLMHALDSLLSCHFIGSTVEIYPILNHPDNAPSDILNLHVHQFEEIQKLEKLTAGSKYKVLATKPCSLPNRIAGVGLARKIGMDEAVRRFDDIGKNGILLNFDADCLCDPSYLKEVKSFFDSEGQMDAVSIGFKHRLDDLSETLADAIILYELHLRAYIGWQAYYNYPFAFQTLGSSFGVRSKAYQAQGGMNKRKAGEDFYFLHKYSKVGKLITLKKPLVFPSGRISGRVPFGTGKAVNDIVHSKEQYKTYNPAAIEVFCNFFNGVANSYSKFLGGMHFEDLTYSKSLIRFMGKINFQLDIERALQNSASEIAFQKRIAQSLSPFCLMKFLHDSRLFEFRDVDVMQSALGLLNVRMPGHAYKTLTALELRELIMRLDYKDGFV